MLIFDGFPTTEKAQAFATAVMARFGLRASVCLSQVESNKVDPFPWELAPPIVLVERPPGPPHERVEQQVERLVEDYDGEFAGT